MAHHPRKTPSSSSFSNAERCADRLPLPVPLAKIRDRFPVVANVGLEFAQPHREFLRGRGILPNEIKIQQQVECVKKSGVKSRE